MCIHGESIDSIDSQCASILSTYVNRLSIEAHSMLSIEAHSTTMMMALKRLYYEAIAASIQITWDLGWSGHIVESHQMHERKAHTMELIEYRSKHIQKLPRQWQRLKRLYYAAIAASIQITWDLGWSGHIVESHQMHERKAHTMELIEYRSTYKSFLDNGND